MKKEITKFNAQELKEKRDTAATMKFNGAVYNEFKIIMKEQGLAPSAVINQFMKLTNDLLKDKKGGEICFIFEPVKKEGGWEKFHN